MTPRTLSDDELLRYYDDVFDRHEATRELALRYANGDGAAQGRIEELEIEKEDLEAQIAGHEDVPSLLADLVEAINTYLEVEYLDVRTNRTMRDALIKAIEAAERVL